MGQAASVNQNMTHTLDLLLSHPHINVTALFSPQHGWTGVKQANMIPSGNSEFKGIPLFSLYSEKTRRLTPQMLSRFDVLVVDLQDTGCRIYTYLTSLCYALEDGRDKTIVVLDRPNPLGRKVEGSRLKKGFESFVGTGPLPMSHGLTLGEAALWFKDHKKLKTDLMVVPMKNYSPNNPQPLPFYIQPSPNMTGLSCARCYPGTVLLEGTKISEGRGTTLPLEVFGMPGMKTEQIKKQMKARAPEFLTACRLRQHEFEPVFDKFKGQVCRGFQIHTGFSLKEGPFRPYRLISLFLKCFYEVHEGMEWKAPPPYEYEYEKQPVDILSGCDRFRKWVEDPAGTIKEWDEWLTEEETLWKKERAPFLLYS